MSDNKQNHYQSALNYWANVPPTVDGVLGGFGHISKLDIDGSNQFLQYLFRNFDVPNKKALDCGAGIGRVSKYLLLPNFEKVDLVEPDEKFVNHVQEFVGNENYNRIELKFNCCLQDLKLEQKYDVIWHQWVLGHLMDDDLVNYLNRCRCALTENGVIVVKENITSSGTLEIDSTDSSVTRSLNQLIEIFKKSRLKRIKQCRQTNFPEGLYPVYMFALQPMKDGEPLEADNL